MAPAVVDNCSGELLVLADATGERATGAARAGAALNDNVDAVDAGLQTGTSWMGQTDPEPSKHARWRANRRQALSQELRLRSQLPAAEQRKLV